MALTKDIASMVPVPRTSWRARVIFAFLLTLAVATLWATHAILTERYTAATKNRAEVRMALYVGNLMTELQRSSIVPLLLSRDPHLIGALNSDDFSTSSQRLIEYREEIGAAGILLLDETGRAVAASDRNQIGTQHRSQPYFVDAQRSNDTVFTTWRGEAGGYSFTYSRKIVTAGKTVGVIAVAVDLAKFQQIWAGFTDAVLVTNSEGTIILATESRWRGRTEAEALALRSPTSAITRAVQATADWAALPADAIRLGENLMRTEARIPFQGWRMASFTTYASVRARVNGVLALQLTAFAVLTALGFYVASRRAEFRSVLFQQKSAELRLLNARLQREIAERQKVEKSLEVAEQTLAQSSKLAALGEMSAAVSHELNQPLAAMRTYLAGARLLITRNRNGEALASFQRIDDLIERMGAITKQLKSYARKGGDEFVPVDMRDALAGALAMMEPQLKTRGVRIVLNRPEQPVRIMGDRIRLEQVIVNLLRNAIDATKSTAAPEIEILLAAGETALLSVRDNGTGIDNLESLFEPFYTTKAPGDGVGLGLAISSGIVSDFGGRLTARNAVNGGAVFEVRLPIAEDEDDASDAAAAPPQAAE